LNGESIGDAYMDTDEIPRLVDGLLLATYIGGHSAAVPLLATMSSISSGIVGFERKGFGTIEPNLYEPSALQFFENCEEQTLTLI
jgi:hypothetical protein